MSTDYSAVVVIGYAVDADCLLSNFRKNGEDAWLLDGRVWEDNELSDLIDYLAEKFDCHMTVCGDCYEGEYVVSIESQLHRNMMEDFEHCKFEYIDLVKEDLARIGKALTDFNLDCGPVGIHSVLNVA